VNTRGYEGKIRKGARIHTNAPGAETLQISLTAFVEAAIVVDPPYVLISGPKGESSGKAIDIIAALDRPLKIEPAGCNIENFIQYRIEEVETDKKYRVHLTSNPDAEGIFNGFLNLKTNYPEKPMIHIRINGRISK
jgi:hypothetical protein